MHTPPLFYAGAQMLFHTYTHGVQPGAARSATIAVARRSELALIWNGA